MGTIRVALIAAAGSGMGAGAARKLAGDGFAVGVLSSSGKGEALAGELGGIGVTGASDGATYIPGQNIRVDGGITRSV